MMMRGMKSRTLKGPRRVGALINARSDLDRLVATHSGHVVNKWEHYYEIYDWHLGAYRDQAPSILEIGIQAGGSLELWQQYFGKGARIVGIDIDPECKRFEREGISVRIGSQADPAFLEAVAAEFGPFDVLIDDGSHQFDHQITSFRTLFPHIRENGVYACEDTCSSYWKPEYNGGVGEPGTFVEFTKGLIDEMNAWFWREGVEDQPDAFAKFAHGMHFYPALIVIEKRPMRAPLVTPVGKREK